MDGDSLWLRYTVKNKLIHDRIIGDKIIGGNSNGKRT